MTVKYGMVPGITWVQKRKNKGYVRYRVKDNDPDEGREWENLNVEWSKQR